MSGSTGAPSPEDDGGSRRSPGPGATCRRRSPWACSWSGSPWRSLYWQLWLFVVRDRRGHRRSGTDELAAAMRSKGHPARARPRCSSARRRSCRSWATSLGPAQVLMGYRRCCSCSPWCGGCSATAPTTSSATSTASGFVLAYAPLMGGFAALIAASPDGADRVAHVHRPVDRQRHRRLRRRRAVRQAPDGAGDQPEEVVGGLRRLGHAAGRSWARCCSCCCWSPTGGRARSSARS